MNKKLIKKQLGFKLWENLKRNLEGEFWENLEGKFRNMLWYRICVRIEWKLMDEIKRKLNEQKID
jgi:hypothetical protein